MPIIADSFAESPTHCFVESPAHMRDARGAGRDDGGIPPATRCCLYFFALGIRKWAGGFYNNQPGPGVHLWTFFNDAMAMTGEYDHPFAYDAGNDRYLAWFSQYAHVGGSLFGGHGAFLHSGHYGHPIDENISKRRIRVLRFAGAGGVPTIIHGGNEYQHENFSYECGLWTPGDNAGPMEIAVGFANQNTLPAYYGIGRISPVEFTERYSGGFENAEGDHAGFYDIHTVEKGPIDLDYGRSAIYDEHQTDAPWLAITRALDVIEVYSPFRIGRTFRIGDHTVFDPYYTDELRSRLETLWDEWIVLDFLQCGGGGLYVHYHPTVFFDYDHDPASRLGVLRSRYDHNGVLGFGNARWVFDEVGYTNAAGPEAELQQFKAAGK